MDYINLGRTGLKVSRICLGCMSYGVPPAGPLRPGSNLWSLNEEQSQPFFRQALDLGINFFDTANVYSCGDSERILGRFLKANARREDTVIATKLNGVMRDGPNGGGLSRKEIFFELDESLRRLGTDYVDLYQVHRSDPHHAHRGDARRPQRPGARGQGALPRRIVHVGLAVLQGALSRRPARMVALRHHAAPLQPALPRGGARDASALSRSGHRRFALESAGARQAGASVGCGGDQALRDRRLRQVALLQNAGGRPSRGGSASASWQPRAEFRVRSLPWPGCSPGPQSPRPSSAQPSRTTSTTPSPPSR